jgi:hypothetical protein
MTADLEFRCDDDERGFCSLMFGTSAGRKWIFCNIHLQDACFPVWVANSRCVAAITAAARDDGLRVALNGVRVEVVE